MMRHRLPALIAVVTLSVVLNGQMRGVMVENIDRSASACTDFDAYANGRWRVAHPMPAIETTWAVRTVTQEETRARLHAIAEDDARKAASMPKGSPGQLTGDFYAACMDESRVDALALAPLEQMMKRIDGIRDAKGLTAEIVRLQEIQIAAPVALAAAQDLHDTRRMIAQV